METSNSKPISINIQQQKETTEIPTSSQFENYIIVTNQNLSTECQSLRDEMKNKEIEIDELTAENEKFDNSTRYLRGLLKNYVELETKATCINKKYKTIVDQHTRTINDNFLFPTKNLNMMKIVFVINFLLFLLSIYNSIFSSIFLIFQTTIIYFYVNHKHSILFKYKDIKNDSLVNEIKSIDTEIKKIKSSCDFLGDLIDVA